LYALLGDFINFFNLDCLPPSLDLEITSFDIALDNQALDKVLSAIGRQESFQFTVK